MHSIEDSRDVISGEEKLLLTNALSHFMSCCTDAGQARSVASYDLARLAQHDLSGSQTEHDTVTQNIRHKTGKSRPSAPPRSLSQ